MVSGGDCISKIDGKTVFVPYALPGERLRIQIEREMRDYSTARIVEVLEPSANRATPFCPLYTKCGGCNMQHIATDFQTELRSSILKDAFAREGVDAGDVQVVSANPIGYRARFQLHDGGLMEKRSNRILSIQNCPCATPEVNKYLAEMPFEQRPKGRVHVFGTEKIVSIPEGFDKIIVCNEDSKKDGRVIGKRTVRNGRPTKKIKKVQPRYEGASVKEENLCTVDILGKKITFDVQGFFQSNMQVLEKTIPLITE
ncbi:MAG TPA: class I SAM-dependent RNA methyltransferase, partial [Treponema sp.]|nr:class I SAM-dependent RNA methyltransferase [Treponema sp.]